MMSLTPVPGPRSDLPEVDERLAEPETRYEVEDGRRVYVAPADKPHGESHIKLGKLVDTHLAEGYSAAIDLLTRTSRSDDIAPDVSVYPSAPHPRTGGRQLEELAFEITSTQTLGHVGRRAAKLAARGVRRVFALDVERMRVLEWANDEWKLLERGGQIEDPALAVPIPIDAMLDAARADDAVAHALRLKRHPEFIAERAEGEAKGRAEGLAEGEARGRAAAVLAMLARRGLEPSADERGRILAERDLGRLERWFAAADRCADVAQLLAVP